MARGCMINAFVFVFTVFSFIAPSLSYLEYDLNSKVCSMIRKREFSLPKEIENTAIILKDLHFFDNWAGPFAFICNFSVRASWRYGIIAVIQNLNLRRNETTNECIDYVQFQKKALAFNPFNKDVIKSPQYCGKVNSIRDPDEDEESEERFSYAHNAFVDEKGILEVTIYVAGQRLLPPQKLDFTMTFTAYKSCKDDGQDGLKECKKGSGMCIWEGLFHDKIVNCPYDDCYDEGGCPEISPGGKKQSSGLGTKVTIGAVVLILGLLLLFMLCLFVCRRCQVLCWSGPPPPRPQRSIGPQSVRVEMMTSSGTSGETTRQTQPTAPPLLPLSQTASPVHEDKDLPPPYESLFPSR